VTEQGKANYEGYRAAIMAPMPKWDELSYQAKLGWDAGACSVELWLAEAPVDEDMPGNEPDELAKTVRALDIARDEITALRNLAADILGEFKATGDGHRARIGQVGYARWAERAGLGG
jgi:uncharacterized protein (DUF4415 family)